MSLYGSQSAQYLGYIRTNSFIPAILKIQISLQKSVLYISVNILVSLYSKQFTVFGYLDLDILIAIQIYRISIFIQRYIPVQPDYNSRIDQSGLKFSADLFYSRTVSPKIVNNNYSVC